MSHLPFRPRHSNGFSFNFPAAAPVSSASVRGGGGGGGGMRRGEPQVWLFQASPRTPAGHHPPSETLNIFLLSWSHHPQSGEGEPAFQAAMKLSDGDGG